MIKLFSFIAVFIISGLASVPVFAASINAPQAKLAENNIARGVLRAKQTAEISAAMSGQLLEAPYKSGQFFKSGALLAKFDCVLEEAELAALLQKHETQSLKYETSAELFKHGAAGELEVALAKSEMQQALAEANAIKTRLKYCAVYAPFSGYVTARHISAFETPQRGELLYSLEKAGALELSIIVPSNWVKWLKTGQRLEFSIEETGEIIPAKIMRLGATIDPVSQTLESIANPKASPSALSGMSGHARFKPAS